MIFAPLPPSVGFFTTIRRQIWQIFAPLKFADVLNGWSRSRKIYKTSGPSKLSQVVHSCSQPQGQLLKTGLTKVHS